ncbi:MAG: BamA/TamA family outer membrane protein [Bacteroidota bacterium]
MAMFPGDIAAQIMPLPEQVSGDTVVTAFIPAAAYASDIGFVGTAAISRFRYNPEVAPYVSLTELRLQASTKGFLDLRVLYEHTETLGRSVRSKWTMNAVRHPFDNYFGIGNNTVFDSDRWEDQYYFYDVMRVNLSYQGRTTLYRPRHSLSTLDLTFMAGTRYEQPGVNEGNLIDHEQPAGIEAGWTNKIGMGIIRDSRDNEFAATRGGRMQLSWEWAPRFLLNDYPMTLVDVEIRRFLSIPAPWLRPVLAMRLTGSHAFGTIPFWNMPYLGDELTLRGYPVYRFRGDSAIFYNLELRSWVYHHPFLEFSFGVHAFHDSGRVFTDEDRFRDVLRDYHRTFGGGIVMALFTPDFILRFDAGFSDEMLRLYMNIGYMF